MNQEIEKLLTGCFDRLQELEIKPTLHNMETLVQTLYDLRAIYNKLKEGKADAETDIQ